MIKVSIPSTMISEILETGKINYPVQIVEGIPNGCRLVEVSFGPNAESVEMKFLEPGENPFPGSIHELKSITIKIEKIPIMFSKVNGVS